MARKGKDKDKDTHTPPEPAPAATPLEGLNLGAAKAPPKGRGAPAAELRGAERWVDEYVETTQEIESLEAQRAIARENIEPLASAARGAEEAKTARAVKGTLCYGSQGRIVRVTERDSFRPIEIRYEDALRDALGASFDRLLTPGHKLKLRAGVTLDALTSRFGPAIAEYVDAQPVIEVARNGMELRAALRPSLTDAQNAALDEIFKQVQYAPSFSIK